MLAIVVGKEYQVNEQEFVGIVEIRGQLGNQCYMKLIKTISGSPVGMESTFMIGSDFHKRLTNT